MKLPAFLDIRAVLKAPAIYNAFQSMVGAYAARGEIIRKCIPLGERKRVLEVGCGPGTNLDVMPQGVSYVGCDLSASYVAYAQKKYAGRGIFIHAAVGELLELGQNDFDYVLASGLLHHLDDTQVNVLCREVSSVLRPGGRFIALEAIYCPEQSFLERHYMSLDRGEYIRHVEEYVALLQGTFPKIETSKYPGCFFTRHAGCIFLATKPGPERA